MHINYYYYTLVIHTVITGQEGNDILLKFYYCPLRMSYTALRSIKD